MDEVPLDSMKSSTANMMLVAKEGSPPEQTNSVSHCYNLDITKSVYFVINSIISSLNFK